MGLKESTGSRQKFVEEVYEHQWTIPNWFTLIQNTNKKLSDLKFEIFTGKPNRLQTKWICGLIQNPYTSFYSCYWKMVEMTNFTGEIEASLSTSLCGNHKSKDFFSAFQLVKPKVNEFIKVYMGLPVKKTEIKTESDDLRITLVLTIKVPISVLVTQLHEINVVNSGLDFLGILRDESTADLKIITSDEKEMFAHICILKARCPVFESMFRSKYSEGNTGIINVEDISGKTMEILLHYFYSGKLLSSWKDSDIVSEFLYAAGKYQMSVVLEIVDLELADYYSENREDIGLQEQLLDITNKLSLHNAETRLQKNLIEPRVKIVHDTHS